MPLEVATVVFKKIHGRKTDDWIDKLNHVFTVMILLIFAAVISTKQFVGEPIKCWNPPEYTIIRNTWDKYIHDYCWVKNTYHIPFDDNTILPVNIPTRKNAEITYYQWTPLILLFMAFLFKFPHLLWKILNTSTGLNVSRLCSIADECICTKPEDFKKRMHSVVSFMDKWLISLTHNTYAKPLSWLKGKYLSMLYIAIKLLYMANVVGQIFMLGEFLNLDYSFGIDFVQELYAADVSRLTTSPRFPRVTMCDFEIRRMQNIQRYTVQCVLPFNLFNEKIFIFLWFWYIIVALLSFINLSKWAFWLVFKRNNYKFVKKYLKISGQLNKDDDIKKCSGEFKKKCREFAESYIRDDGCFVLRMIAHNSSDVVVIDILHGLWKQYTKAKTSQPNAKTCDATETEIICRRDGD